MKLKLLLILFIGSFVIGMFYRNFNSKVANSNLLSSGNTKKNEPTVDGNLTNEGFKRPLVSLTFDDGLESQFDNGVPVLNKYDLRATFFLISGFLNISGHMKSDQIKELIRSGNQVGSHSTTDTYLKDLDPDQLNRALSKSRKDLSDQFFVDVKDFASPGGIVFEEDVKSISKYYRSNRVVNRTFEDSLNTKTNFDVYRIKARVVENSMSAAEIKGWVEEAKSANVWLVIVYHQIDKGGNFFSVTPENFDAQLAEIKNSGVAVVTFGQALDEILPQVSESK